MLIKTNSVMGPETAKSVGIMWGLGVSFEEEMDESYKPVKTPNTNPALLLS